MDRLDRYEIHRGMYGPKDRSFDGWWMPAVRNALDLETDGQITHEDDLPDYNYFDEYEAENIHPGTCARNALRNAGFYDSTFFGA